MTIAMPSADLDGYRSFCRLFLVSDACGHLGGAVLLASSKSDAMVPSVVSNTRLRAVGWPFRFTLLVALAVIGGGVPG